MSKLITKTDLLAWGILNTATKSEDTTAPSKPSQPIDPKWVDLILGKSESVQMKEAMGFINDTANDTDERLAMFDNLEMMVENLDNANGLWKPILALLDHDHTQFQLMAAWVIGTALQNNPKAQKDFLECDGLQPIISHLTDSSPKVKLKILRCVSALITTNTDAFRDFYKVGGFVVFKTIIDEKSPDNTIINRLLFTLNFMLSTQEVDGGVSQLGLTTALACLKCGIVDSLFCVIEASHDDFEVLTACLKFVGVILRIGAGDLVDIKHRSSLLRSQIRANAAVRWDEEEMKEIELLLDLL